MSDIGLPQLAIYAVASLLSTTLSGIAGGGGGFVMTPLLIFLGLSPAEAVSTGKLSGLAVSVGSLHGFKARKVHNKRFVAVVMVIALLIGLLAPFFIVKLEQELYKNILGVLILCMIPVVKLKQLGINEFKPGRWQKVIGWFLLALALILQAVFSGGLGVLVVLVLMSLLGLDSITAQVTKRWSQVLLNTVVVIGVLASGLIVWQVAAIGIITSFAGGKIGSKLALKRGNKFVMNIFIILMILSAVGLLLS